VRHGKDKTPWNLAACGKVVRQIGQSPEPFIDKKRGQPDMKLRFTMDHENSIEQE
jgi:hypothetical protein